MPSILDSKRFKNELNDLPFGDWIITHFDTKNNPVLMARHDFLAQLETFVNT